MNITTRRAQSGLAGVAFALLLNGAVAVVSEHRTSSIALAVLAGLLVAAAGATLGSCFVLGLGACGWLVILISPDGADLVSDDLVYWLYLSGACVLASVTAVARWATQWFQRAYAAPLGHSR